MHNFYSAPVDISCVMLFARMPWHLTNRINRAMVLSCVKGVVGAVCVMKPTCWRSPNLLALYETTRLICGDRWVFFYARPAITGNITSRRAG